MFQQQPEGIRMRLVSRPVQTGLAAGELCVRADALLEQEIDFGVSAGFRKPK